MKRNERTTYNQLKKTVDEKTLYVEIPLTWTHEARQAAHEMLTIEKGMYASCIGPEVVTGVDCIRYTHASEYTAETRRTQENADIDDVAQSLRRTEYAWNGYKHTKEAQEPAEQQATTDTTTDTENAQNGPEKAEEKKEGNNMENYTITKNPDYNSLEITFPGKPSEAVRDALKALKFRWHSVKRVWYGYTTEEEARAAIDGAGGKESAEREARHAEELAERERVLNARNSGRRFIEATAKAYPIEEGSPVVTIEWSENPAFYDWNDTDTLKLSVAAAELILESIDKDVHREGRGYDKTSFRINWKDENGEEMTYSGRYDLGDNGGGLIAHIRRIGEWERTHEEYGKEKDTPDETNDRLKVAAYLQQFTAQRRLDHVPA